MRKIKLLFLFIPFIISKVEAQTKKVVLEDFSGAHCSQCPMGSYYVDSMLAKYPELIAVSLHSYTSYDSMHFAQIDTIYNAYSMGAPMGAVDRINAGTVSNDVAVYITQWDAAIQSQLLVTPEVSLTINPTWNSFTRNISASIDIDILSNLPNGDYRLSMYVAEDSVTGTGSGYDQQNIYNSTPGNPFFGMGNPIVGFIHRHVARAILPYSWGLAGLIPSTPTAGQNFSYTFNYTLPITIDENQVKLIAFVSRNSSTHANDEILNAEETELITGTFVEENNITGKDVLIFPNPANNEIKIYSNSVSEVEIINSIGETVISISNRNSIDVSGLPVGFYVVKINSDGNTNYTRFIKK